MIVYTWVPSQIQVHKLKPELTKISHEFHRPGQSRTQIQTNPNPNKPDTIFTQVGLGHADWV